nr:reverse transcriptase domain-containing protein [Tanacetum cinerariifolium]
MQTRSSSKLPRDQTSNPTSSANPTPKGRIRRSSKQKVENSHFEENLTPVDTMTDNRTMAEMLRAPTEGCAEAIVVPPILAEQFDLKHSLINMMTSEQFFRLEKDNPHDHVRWVVTTAAPITTAAQVPKASAPRRRRGVVIQDPEEIAATSVIMHSEVKSKDKGKGIFIEEPKPLKGQVQIDMDKAFARQLEAELNANINWNDVIEQVKRSEKQDNTVMRYQALKRKHVTEAQSRKNMMIYLKNMVRVKIDFFK